MTRYLNSDELSPPRGYSNGVAMTPTSNGGVLFISGQIGWNREARLIGASFADQFDQALANVIAVVTHAGGTPASIGKLTIFVTRLGEYRDARHEIGRRYRARMGDHYPAMTLVEVSSLLEPGAKVEIEGMACL
jgi:enamine deaminase RidA (YjgF/YER057c/UK114 family)